MAHLTLAGVSDDGKRLLLVSDAGVEFTLDIDPRLRSAVVGEPPRRLETQMDSALRPRDIQARIRAGETPEAVAEAAQTSVDKIMAYAAPVLAERQHVADRAQRSSVRRSRTGDAGSAGGARTLGDSVEAFLRSINVDPDTVEWDSWRREDGRWTLTGAFSATRRKGAAHFIYDAPGNYVTADNDDARWLLGEVVEDEAQTPEARDDLRRARQRRLSAVPEDELPLGVDAIELVSRRSRSRRSSPTSRRPTSRPARGGGRRGRAGHRHRRRRRAPTPASPSPRRRSRVEEPAAEEEPPARRPVKKSRGRACVPSWDEIMFGGGQERSASDRGRRPSSTRVSPARRSYLPVVSRHVVLRHRRHGVHRPSPRPGAARPPRGHDLRAGPQGLAPPDGDADPAAGAPTGSCPVTGDLSGSRPRRREEVGHRAPGRRSTTSSTSPRSTT